MSSRAQYNPYSSSDSSRPMSAIRAAGYSSRVKTLEPFAMSLYPLGFLQCILKVLVDRAINVELGLCRGASLIP